MMAVELKVRLMAKKYGHLTQLGRPAALPASPDKAVLETVPNPNPRDLYLVRFTAPEFTTLCPMTGQPDFAHLVIDYAPKAKLIESKSLKLFLGSFRNHADFHEACTLMHRPAAGQGAGAALASDRRLLVSARRHADRRVLADRRAAQGTVAARYRRRQLPRPGIAGGAMARLPPTPKRPPKQATPLRAARRHPLPRRCGWASMPWASPPATLTPEARAERLAQLTQFVELRLPGRHGLAGRTDAGAAPIRRRCGPMPAPSCRWRSTTGRPVDPRAAQDRRAHGAISVYAQGRDYHEVMKTKLKALGRFIWDNYRHSIKVFVDTAPLMEKPCGAGGGPWLAGQAHQPGVAPLRLLAVPGRVAALGRAAGRCRRERPLRPVPRLPRFLSDRGFPRALPDSMPGAASPTSRSSTRAPSTASSASPRQPHLWLRRLPGRLPVEQIRPDGSGGSVPAAP